MTGKRYYGVDYDEQYYIFDSNVIRKGRVEEEAEYSYDVFANSMSSTEIIDKLNELTNENEQLKQDRNEMFIRERDARNELRDIKIENEQLKETINEVKTDEKQLSISFMGYKMQLIEVLQQNYNYAYSQRQKNLDKSIVAKTYEVLAQTVCNIAETMNVDIERFPKDGDD